MCSEVCNMNIDSDTKRKRSQSNNTSLNNSTHDTKKVRQDHSVVEIGDIDENSSKWLLIEFSNAQNVSKIVH